MNLLLDTSTFLWYVSADKRLPAKARDLIAAAENDVWLSVVSVWEVIVKSELKRLQLPAPAWSYVMAQRERHAVASLALEESALTYLAKLPSVHRDPFDRMLVCQALAMDLAIVTNDPLIDRYPVRTIW